MTEGFRSVIQLVPAANGNRMNGSPPSSKALSPSVGEVTGQVCPPPTVYIAPPPQPVPWIFLSSLLALLWLRSAWLRYRAGVPRPEINASPSSPARPAMALLPGGAVSVDESPDTKRQALETALANFGIKRVDAKRRIQALDLRLPLPDLIKTALRQQGDAL